MRFDKKLQNLGFNGEQVKLNCSETPPLSRCVQRVCRAWRLSRPLCVPGAEIFWGPGISCWISWLDTHSAGIPVSSYTLRSMSENTGASWRYGWDGKQVFRGWSCLAENSLHGLDDKVEPCNSGCPCCGHPGSTWRCCSIHDTWKKVPVETVFPSLSMGSKWACCRVLPWPLWWEVCDVLWPQNLTVQVCACQWARYQLRFPKKASLQRTIQRIFKGLKGDLKIFLRRIKACLHLEIVSWVRQMIKCA